MFVEGDNVLGVGQGEGLRIQQPQCKIANQGSFRAQQGQWLQDGCMGVTCCLEMRQMDFTGGTQQPLTVVGMGEREKQMRAIGQSEGTGYILAMDSVHAEEGKINPS